MTLSGLRILTIRGIPIRIHFTFLIILPLLAWSFARTIEGAARMAEVPPERLAGNPFLWGLGIAVALFASVLLHELAHSLYAIAKGGRIRGITLLMIGGVSEVAEPPRDTKHEAMMALAGPLVSLALAAVFFGLYSLADGVSFNLRFALFHLALLNAILGVFNLLPAFPMDGGRILRSLLSRRIGHVRATNISATVGKGFAVVFGIVGLLTGNIILLVIAFFVYIGAEGETRNVMVKAPMSR